MTLKVGINGFGRIGRVVFRTCFEHPELEIVAINDPAIDVEYIRYLMKYDSTHGKFKSEVICTNNEIIVNGKKVKVFHHKSPASIPWFSVGVEYVVEASGIFNTKEKASGHLISGEVKRVIVTAPSVDVPMVILGVNQDTVTTDHKIVSSGSSTLYCLAPIIKVLEDKYGVKEGFMTSIHAMTPSLKPLDGLCLRGKHWRDHRGIHQNIIPATTGACRALERIIPSMKDKLAGLGFRVPIVNVSVLDISIRVKKQTTLRDIIQSVENKSKTSMKNIINTSKDDAVSSDFISDYHSCTLDENSCLELNPNYFKLVCWYENEYSFACRIVDLILFCEKQHVEAESKTSIDTIKVLKQQEPVKDIHSGVEKELSIEGSLSVSLRSINTFTTDGELEFKCPSQILRTTCEISPHRKLHFCHASILSSISRAKRNIEMSKVWTKAAGASQSNMNVVFKKCSPKERLVDIKREWQKLTKRDVLRYKTSHSIELFKPNARKKVCKLNLNSPHDSCNENTLVQNISDRTIECDRSSEDVKETEKSLFDISPKKCDSCKDITKSNTTKCRTQLNSNDDREETLSRAAEEYGFGDIIMLSETDEPNVGSKNFACKDGEAKASKMISTNEEPTLDQYSGKLITAHTRRVLEFIGKEINKDSAPTTSKKPEYLSFKKTLEKYITQSKQNLIEGNKNLRVSNSSTKTGRSESIHTIRPADQGGEASQRYVNDSTETFDQEQSTRSASTCSLKSITSVKQNEYDTMSLREKEHKAISKETVESYAEINKIPIFESCRNSSRVSSAMRPTREDSFLPFRSKMKPIPPKKLDIYDKLDSRSGTDSETSLIDRRKSRVIYFTDLTNSLEDLENLDKICKIIEISDELSDNLFSSIENNNEFEDCVEREWSFKRLCEKINLEEFCNKVFHTV